MKRLSFVIVLFFLLSPFTLQSQTLYQWSDSLAVSSTAVDTTFSPMWNGCTLMFEGGDGWIKVGTTPADTVGWSTKSWVKVAQRQPYYVWPTDHHPNRLRYLKYKVASGTAALFITGYKNVYQ